MSGGGVYVEEAGAERSGREVRRVTHNPADAESGAAVLVDVVAVVALFEAGVVGEAVPAELKHAGRIAAVAVGEVEVVALLVGLQDAVPAGLKLASRAASVVVGEVAVVASLKAGVVDQAVPADLKLTDCVAAVAVAEVWWS